MSEYFPNPKYLGEKAKVELDLCNYATKANLKPNVVKLVIDKLKNVQTSLSNLKSKVDQFDVDNLVRIPFDLSNLRDVVKSDIVRKDVYKIPDITNLATKTTNNAKINEVEDEIPNITNLASTSALTDVENKISSTSKLVQKTDYNTKTNEIEKKITDHNHDKYITTSELNKFKKEILDLRLKRANLASQNDIANFVNQKDSNNKLNYVISNKKELNESSK